VEEVASIYDGKETYTFPVIDNSYSKVISYFGFISFSFLPCIFFMFFWIITVYFK